MQSGCGMAERRAAIAQIEKSLAAMEKRSAGEQPHKDDQSCNGERRPVLDGDDEDVPVPQDVVRVGAASPVAVRDRVTLEQDTGTGGERSNGFNGADGGDRGHEQQRQ